MPIDRELLERIVNTPGIPGFEDEVQDVAAEALDPVCDEVSRDRVGNVIGLKRATKRPGTGRAAKIVLAAHVDEIGMMVKHIDDRGFVKCEPVGGLNAKVLVSQPVRVHGKETLRGVIAPDFRPDQGDKVPRIQDMRVDLALPADRVKELVTVGDVVTFDQDLVDLNADVFMGRNFDDRIGTYCLVEAMRRLGEVSVDVYAVSSVQEEVGVRGMPPAAFAIEPDLGLAIDGSLTWGPYFGETEYNCALGGGVGIYIMDNLTIGDRRVVAHLLDLCQGRGIAHQRNIGGGTDASAIQRTARGALTTTVGAPVRYMHSTVQLCHRDDMEATSQLLVAFAETAHELAEACQR
ncbi:MAG: M42 family peptidase [Armatimonadia bacterium]|nr:M42 family peptidase [Armatimonadia bacterium]